ncbi:AtpZ/AtpI family protein [Flavobacterium ammonificans]|jgi:hypothetical protein|uniref:AtpZ/AtpI family protein n=1 Tax=Flavobacterium ammonificans TaxID=1751056 RepID=A0ABM7UXQ3_9FLAO|nr:AtpZ/AtpI family protein [Flavobacterium ammonificans]BDB52230.1 hypothetical protein GENT11_05420 [Flavobacterium ammonificans]
MENKLPTKKNKWLVLITIPAQMGITIFLFSFLGEWLDNNYPNDWVYYHKVLLIIGVFLAMYNTIRLVNQVNKQ